MSKKGKKSMNGNPEHEGGLTENEQAIMEKELPGRGMLAEFKDRHPELALNEKEVVMSGELKKAEIILDEQGNEVWRKDIAYEREQDPDTKEWKDTSEIKAVSERVFDRDGQGLIIKETGTNLDRQHSYGKNFEYDDQGNQTRETGTVTEGEKKGETWAKTKTVEQVGDYAKETVNNSGKHLKDGQLVDFSTSEVNYLDDAGKSVWGYHEADGQRTMEWGKKPADLDI